MFKLTDYDFPCVLLVTDYVGCPVQEAFAIGDILKELPCQHRFHQGGARCPLNRWER